ncbi:acetolactate decarboxylase [Adhaeribacter pallidiroseus]|nr:acetolactate decarboxylase [Adhaeribacter pallidiroseus]
MTITPMHFIRLILLFTFFLNFNQVFAQKGVATTFSTIDALLAGLYEGTFTVKELKQRGNFGIGTFHSLNGELLMLNGKVYQIQADGSSQEVQDTTRIPWATVSFFQEGQQHHLPDDLTYTSFQKEMDKVLASPNLSYAIWVEGVFSIKVRSVPAQTKPYPKMTQIVDQQSVFNYQNIRGTLVGFRSPAYVKGINIPGFHLHFLSADGKRGGHVLDFIMERGTVQTEKYHELSLVLPTNKAFLEVDLVTDKTKDLQQVEK